MTSEQGPPTALLVGATGGIGRAIGDRLVADGYRVCLAGRSRAAMDELVSRATSSGTGFVGAVELDLAQPDSIAAAVIEAAARLGRVDVLVAASGIAGPVAPLVDADPADWTTTIMTNLVGTALLVKAVLPTMIAQQSGSVVIIGSMSGKHPLADRTAYSASKTGLIGLVRSLAAEAGQHGVRVNLVSPGPTDGPRLQRVVAAQAEASGRAVADVAKQFLVGNVRGRAVDAREVAGVVGFLASDASSGVTGDDINVSAGASWG